MQAADMDKSGTINYTGKIISNFELKIRIHCCNLRCSNLYEGRKSQERIYDV